MKHNPETLIVLETDGSTKQKDGSIGPSAIGIVVLSGWGSVIYEESKQIGMCTSTAAEIIAVREGLKIAIDLGYPRVVELRSDAKIVLEHLRFDYRFADEHLNHYLDQVLDLTSRLDGVEWIWVPRFEMKHADALSKAAWHRSPNSVIKGIRREAFPPLSWNYRQRSEIELLLDNEDMQDEDID